MKKLFAFCLMMAIACAAQAQDIDQLKRFPKMYALMRLNISIGLSALSECGYVLDEEMSGETGLEMKVHFYEHPDYKVDHPAFEEINDFIILGDRKDKIALIHYNISPRVEDNTLNYITEITEFEKSIAEAGFTEKSVKEGEFSVEKYFHNSSDHLKIKLVTFHISSMVLGADVFIYEWDIQDSDI